jgi:hypothetical protein
MDVLPINDGEASSIPTYTQLGPKRHPGHVVMPADRWRRPMSRRGQTLFAAEGSFSILPQS